MPSRTTSPSGDVLATPEPVRSGQKSLTSTPISTSSSFPEFSHVPNHNDFIKLMLNAKAYADLNQTTATVQWKGHSTMVEPNLPPFTKEVLKEKLEQTLKTMKVI